MKRKPIYYFKNKDQEGISEVPVNSLVVIEDRDDGRQQKIIITGADASHTIRMKLRKFMHEHKNLYKNGGFDNSDNERTHQDLDKKIRENRLIIDNHEQRITYNEKRIDDNRRDIIKNEQNIGYNRVQIDKNTKDIADLDQSTSSKIAKNAQDIIQNKNNIDRNANNLTSYKIELDQFHNSPEFGDGTGEINVALFPRADQESHIVAITKDSNDKVNGYHWRIGDFTDRTAPVWANTGVKIDSSSENIVLAVPADKRVYARIGGDYQEIQTSRHGNTTARPADPRIGEMFFDVQLRKPVWCESEVPNVRWIDAMGKIV